MMCKDCLHRDGCCNFVPIEGTIEEKAEYLYECLKKPCKDFKNKDDFVEVVRCKDCKYYIPDADVDHSEFPNYLDADGFCDNMLKYTDKMCYCSYGKKERKMNKETTVIYTVEVTEVIKTNLDEKFIREDYPEIIKERIKNMMGADNVLIQDFKVFVFDKAVADECVRGTENDD